MGSPIEPVGKETPSRFPSKQGEVLLRPLSERAPTTSTPLSSGSPISLLHRSRGSTRGRTSPPRGFFENAPTGSERPVVIDGLDSEVKKMKIAWEDPNCYPIIVIRAKHLPHLTTRCGNVIHHRTTDSLL